jgi:hypothetical protein
MVLIFFCVVLRIHKKLTSNIDYNNYGYNFAGVLAPMRNLWRMVKVYMVITLYVVWFSTQAIIKGRIQANEVQFDQRFNFRICNVISDYKVLDEYLWFFKRLCQYTIFKIPVLLLIWESRQK